MRLLRDLTIEKDDSLLVEALFGYIACELEAGNYNTLKNHKNENPEWTLEDEIDVIKWILRASRFDIPDNLEEIIKSDIASSEEKLIRLPQIAHLLSSFDILSNYEEKIEPIDALSQLRHRGILILEEEGMPGPCLVYINAIKNSSLDDRLKMSLIHNVASKILRSMDIFDPFLAKIALRAATDELSEFVDRMEQGSLKNKLCADIEMYINQAQHTKDTKKPTFISNCIIKYWRNVVL
jgi:hypothetical protein